MWGYCFVVVCGVDGFCGLRVVLLLLVWFAGLRVVSGDFWNVALVFLRDCICCLVFDMFV